MDVRPRLLAVDDDRMVVPPLVHLAAAEGFDVRVASGVDDATRHLRAWAADLVLIDEALPGANGRDGLDAVRAASPSSRVVVTTRTGSIDGAVDAVRRGAADYLTKPFDIQRLRHLLADVRRSRGEAVLESPEGEFCGLVGASAVMQTVFDMVRRVAPHARTTLVTGETGTGKELVARALHASGPRRHRRLVTVNCSALVETLFESELFGHVRGAFTGASEHKAGLFEAADGGTLFLDEVGELPAAVQAKLLRVLEDGEVQRVGAVESRRVDVRLIAASNRDLQAEVLAGRFRGDLFYRLNVVRMHLPPLRERREDVPALARAFVRACAARIGRRIDGLTAGAEAMLTRRPWDGNVRELRNAIERACILAEGHELSERDFAGSDDASAASAHDIRPGTVVVPIGARQTVRLAEVEREHILRTLQQVQGNKAVAARLLGISRRAFYRQLERHGLHRRLPSRTSRHGNGSTALERAS